MRTPSDPKEIPRTRELFRREILRAKAAHLGLPFDREVELLRQRRRILDALTQRDEKIRKAVAALRRSQTRFAAEADEARTKAGRQRVSARGAERIGRGPDLGALFGEVSRAWNMTFSFGVGTGAPMVEGTRDGMVGWCDNVDRIVNDDTGETRTASFFLLWYVVLPRAGYYKLHNSASGVCVDVEYRLRGSGLWGEDALCDIWVGSGLRIGNADEGLGTRALAVHRTSSVSLPSCGTLDRWYPLANVNQVFRIDQPNTGVTFAIMMDIQTWAEGGKVQVDVNDFWLPSVNANSDFWVNEET